MPAVLVLFPQLFRGPLCVLTDSLRSESYSVIFSPKLRLQTICCLVGGASQATCSFSPFSSRTVRSRTTEKFSRMKAGFVRARSSAVLMPRTLSLRAYCFPRPRSLRPAAVKAVSAFAVDSPGQASTPRNCFHSFEAHWADFARVFVGPAPTTDGQTVQSYTCWRSCRPKSSRSMQCSTLVRSRNISSIEYCSTLGASSSSSS